VADAVLAFGDLVVAFGALRAVDGVTLSVSRGERRAIIGPNGAGKTTLFNAVTGIIRPTADVSRSTARTSRGYRPIGAPGWASRGRFRSPTCFRHFPLSTISRSRSAA
jgi:ABC-type branched-subunit amino acid transport system ATPase component